MKKLDRMTPIAVGGALGAVLFSMVIEGSNPMVLFKPAPLILVFVGTAAAAAAGFMKNDVQNIKNVIKEALGTPEHSPEEDITRMVQLAELARREGLLALEKAAEDVDDPFFRKGVQLTVDGVDGEEIEDILEGEMRAIRERHKMGAKFFQDMGGFSPTLGIIGTVVGLIHVLGNLNDPNSIGPAIGSAFTATLWGVMAANVFWLPIANKLKRATELELHGKRMIMDGLLAVQAGNSPRMIQARLQSYLSPKDRAAGKPGAAEEAA
jgi:chemotaxis protein MotA